MILQFNNIRLNNFMSFDDETVNFNNLGYTLVSGKNESVEDSALSNGSGKSSIWEGIVWALCGETIRGNKNVVNLFGTDGAIVRLDFNVDNKHFIIQRTKDHSKFKSSLTISIDGKDVSGKGIRDSEAILKQQLPDLTSSLLSSVIILGQGLPQRFSNNTPSGRKQVLEQLSKSDFMIEDLKQRITLRKSFLNSELDKIQRSIVAINTKKEIYTKQLIEAKDRLDSLLQSSIEDLNSKILELTDECKDAQSKITSLQQVVDAERIEADSIKESFYAKQAESNQRVLEITSKYSNELRDISLDIARVENEYSLTRNELLRIKNIKDVCPTCGQKLVGVIKPDITPVEEKLTSLESKIEELKEKQSKIELEKSKALKENDALYVEQLQQIQERKEVISKKLNEDDKKLRTYGINKESAERELAKVEQRLTSISLDKKVTEDTINSLSNDLQRIDSELLYYNNEEEDTKSHLAVINKMETIIKRDFRGCLLKNVIDFINAKVKSYSKIVFNNDLVEFKQEGNNISISFDNKEYESLSGGEQKKLDIIIQLAIRNMLCNLLNFSSNILVCDEIFDALDAAGCQRVIDLVSTQLEDVSSIFIVTHRDNLCIPCDNNITVVKDINKISHVIQTA